MSVEGLVARQVMCPPCNVSYAFHALMSNPLALAWAESSWAQASEAGAGAEAPSQERSIIIDAIFKRFGSFDGGARED